MLCGGAMVELEPIPAELNPTMTAQIPSLIFRSGALPLLGFSSVRSYVKEYNAYSTKTTDGTLTKYDTRGQFEDIVIHDL